MKITVVWVGRTHEEWVKRAVEEYAGRIRRYIPLQTIEVKEEKGTGAESARERECLRISRALPRAARVIVLDERGTEMPSTEFAGLLSRARDEGVSDLAFVIGGAYGFSSDFRSNAAQCLALSRMTFTHQMARIFLLEQVYRGFTIMHGEPYHH